MNRKRTIFTDSSNSHTLSKRVIKIRKRTKNPYINFIQHFLKSFSGDWTSQRAKFSEAAAKWQTMSKEQRELYAKRNVRKI